MLLEEFDGDKTAIVEPQMIVEKINGIPSVAVGCFSRGGFQKLLDFLSAKPLDEKKHYNMAKKLYIGEKGGEDLLIFRPPMGAPSCVASIEEIYAMGVENIVLFGSCGVLYPDITQGTMIVPTSALRDEGTSYHYCPPSDEIDINVSYLEVFEYLLKSRDIKYIKGKVWTTDAFYRETRTKLEKRLKQGCICVDMECSAVAAVAKFREKGIFHFFYAADELSHEGWNIRRMDPSSKLSSISKTVESAVELALSLKKGQITDTI